MTIESNSSRGQMSGCDQTLQLRVGHVPDLAVTALAGDHGPAFQWTAPVTATYAASVRNAGILTSSTCTVHFKHVGEGGGLVVERTVPVTSLPHGDVTQAVAGLPVGGPL